MRFQPSLFLAVLLLSTSVAWANYVNFESQQVHPIALSLDGKQVYAVNTPDNRLAVFDIVPAGLRLAFEVPVGLEPVSVAVRNHHEVWVVNQISDTVSIVDLQARRVRATLNVGDEPTDVVFAGPLRERAFVCVSQEDAVKIYDPDNLSAAPEVVPLFASDPQAMAVSPDYLTVYVAIFESGNQTTIASEVDVAAHGGTPPPHPPDAPDTSLILRYDKGQWVDELGTSYNDTHPFTLPDHDVAVLDASMLTPVPQYIDGLGTLNFNIGVHPRDHRVFVSNCEALNQERFEPTLRGRFVQTRMSIVDPFAPQQSKIVDLNPHIDTSTTPGSQNEIDRSLSQPGGMAFESSGRLLYLTALGSSKVALLDGEANVLDLIDVGPGPSGLALDEGGRRLYVLCRFSNSIDVVDTYKRVLLTSVPLYDPTPAAIRDGRRFLYDGRLSSGHGDLACASCHAGANLDGIAWDLGDPNGAFVDPPPGSSPLLTGFHPLKGPMVTQTLRGLADTQPLHWRGDRAGFSDFNGAFVSLMGRDTPLPVSDMQAFEDFVMSIEYAPNPGLLLDGSYPSPASGPNPARGELIFRTQLLVSTTCAFCHAQPWGGHSFIINAPAARSTQDVVVPQLRNQYEKTGFDKSPGEKKRGFGYHHDGSVPNLTEFLVHPSFDFTSDAQRADVESFLLHFNTGMPPAVGAQRTFDAANHNDPQSNNWAAQMQTIAEGGGCDLIVKGQLQNEAVGWLYMGNGLFRSDLNGEEAFTWNALMQEAAQGNPLTLSGVPAGCGMRMGIDRDADGFPDRTEVALGTDPTNPDSRPTLPTDVGPIAGAGRGPLQVSSYPNPAPVWKGTTISFALTQRQEVRVHIYDVAGRLVIKLQDGMAGPGLVEVPWDGRNGQQVPVASGKYYYRIATPQGSTSRSLLLVR